MNQQQLYFAHALVIERGKPGTVMRFNREFFATSKDDVAGQMKRYVDSELPGCVWDWEFLQILTKEEEDTPRNLKKETEK